MAKPPGSRATAVAAAILVALGILGALLYIRQGADDQASKAEAARVAAEARAREETDKRAKAEALTREEAERRSKLEANAAKKEAEAKREVELAAKARAEEEAKKAAEDKAKALVLKKEEEERRKADIAAKKETEAKARAEVEARRKAEEQAKADAAKKAEKARQAARRSGTVFHDCPDCPRMVVIPAGEFTMGSPASEVGRDNDEGPQHRVIIQRPFAAGRYEVTFDEWDTCVRENGCGHIPQDAGWGRGRRPVINVSWRDAKRYAEWLSRKTGKRYRLLTEAEWEYVGRAGTTTAYSTGETIASFQANFGARQTVPVDSYGPNAFGLFDVHGNVWEWTEDCWNANYNGAPADGSAWLSGNCSLRVLRGESWYFDPRFVRSADRDWGSAEVRSYVNGNGFRLGRTLANSHLLNLRLFTSCRAPGRRRLLFATQAALQRYTGQMSRTLGK